MGSGSGLKSPLVSLRSRHRRRLGPGGWRSPDRRPRSVRRPRHGQHHSSCNRRSRLAPPSRVPLLCVPHALRSSALRSSALRSLALRSAARSLATARALAAARAFAAALIFAWAAALRSAAALA